MEVVSGDNGGYNTWKASVKSSTPTNHHQNIYGSDAIRVAQPTVSNHWK